MATDNTVGQVVGITPAGSNVAKDLAEGAYAPVWAQLGDWGAPPPAELYGTYMRSGLYCHVVICAADVSFRDANQCQATITLPVAPGTFQGSVGELMGVVSSPDGSVVGGVSSLGGTALMAIQFHPQKLLQYTTAVTVAAIYRTG